MSLFSVLSLVLPPWWTSYMHYKLAQLLVWLLSCNLQLVSGTAFDHVSQTDSGPVSQPCCQLSQTSTPFASDWTFCLDPGPGSPLVLFGIVNGPCYQHQILPTVFRPCRPVPCCWGHCLCWSHPWLLAPSPSLREQLALAAFWHNENAVSIMYSVVFILGKLLHLLKSNLSWAIIEKKDKYEAPTLQFIWGTMAGEYYLMLS